MRGGAWGGEGGGVDVEIGPVVLMTQVVLDLGSEGKVVGCWGRGGGRWGHFPRWP